MINITINESVCPICGFPSRIRKSRKTVKFVSDCTFVNMAILCKICVGAYQPTTVSYNWNISITTDKKCSIIKIISNVYSYNIGWY